MHSLKKITRTLLLMSFSLPLCSPISTWANQHPFDLLENQLIVSWYSKKKKPNLIERRYEEQKKLPKMNEVNLTFGDICKPDDRPLDLQNGPLLGILEDVWRSFAFSLLMESEVMARIFLLDVTATSLYNSDCILQNWAQHQGLMENQEMSICMTTQGLPMWISDTPLRCLIKSESPFVSLFQSGSITLGKNEKGDRVLSIEGRNSLENFGHLYFDPVLQREVPRVKELLLDLPRTEYSLRLISLAKRAKTIRMICNNPMIPINFKTHEKTKFFSSWTPTLQIDKNIFRHHKDLKSFYLTISSENSEPQQTRYRSVNLVPRQTNTLYISNIIETLPSTLEHLSIESEGCMIFTNIYNLKLLKNLKKIEFFGDFDKNLDMKLLENFPNLEEFCSEGFRGLVNFSDTPHSMVSKLVIEGNSGTFKLDEIKKNFPNLKELHIPLGSLDFSWCEKNQKFRKLEILNCREILNISSFYITDYVNELHYSYEGILKNPLIWAKKLNISSNWHEIFSSLYEKNVCEKISELIGICPQTTIEKFSFIKKEFFAKKELEIFDESDRKTVEEKILPRSKKILSDYFDKDIFSCEMTYLAEEMELENVHEGPIENFEKFIRLKELKVINSSFKEKEEVGMISEKSIQSLSILENKKDSCMKPFLLLNIFKPKELILSGVFENYYWSTLTEKIESTKKLDISELNIAKKPFKTEDQINLLRHLREVFEKLIDTFLNLEELKINKFQWHFLNQGFLENIRLLTIVHSTEPMFDLSRTMKDMESYLKRKKHPMLNFILKKFNIKIFDMNIESFKKLKSLDSNRLFEIITIFSKTSEDLKNFGLDVPEDFKEYSFLSTPENSEELFERLLTFKIPEEKQEEFFKEIFESMKLYKTLQGISDHFLHV